MSGSYPNGNGLQDCVVSERLKGMTFASELQGVVLKGFGMVELKVDPEEIQEKSVKWLFSLFPEIAAKEF